MFLRVDGESSSHASKKTSLDVPAIPLDRFQALRQLLDATKHRLWRFAELDPHIRMLEEMVFALEDPGLHPEAFLSSLSGDLMALQHVAYCRWETELEHRFVDGLGPSPHIDEYPLAQRFRRLIQREVELLGEPRPERLLFIGSGPVPVSAILLHESLGIRVDCVDADSSAVSQSRALLERLSLSDKVRVHLADGSGVDASEYDAVVIALLAKPKGEILKQLATSTRQDCKVICRTSLSLRTLVYEPMDTARDLQHYRVADKRLAQQRGDTISSLLLTRCEA